MARERAGGLGRGAREEGDEESEEKKRRRTYSSGVGHGPCGETPRKERGSGLVMVIMLGHGAFRAGLSEDEEGATWIRGLRRTNEDGDKIRSGRNEGS